MLGVIDHLDDSFSRLGLLGLLESHHFFSGGEVCHGRIHVDLSQHVLDALINSFVFKYFVAHFFLFIGFFCKFGRL